VSLYARDPSWLSWSLTHLEGSGEVFAHPMAIVWPCSVSVEMYVADGRGVVVPRQSCPACSSPMGFWSGYHRSVRVDGLFHRLWICRARCAGCSVSHALIPSFLLIGRHDVVAVIGGALAGIGFGCSIGRMADRLDVPFTTVRGWVRRFRARAGMWLSGFAALTVEFGGVTPTRWPMSVPAAAVAAMGWAHRAAVERQPVLTPGLWGFVSVVCGGALITTNTDPPWRVFGNRRFIPPAPPLGS
jgi:hypothetical protein